ncbi:LysR family transcriptional regulator [Cystobacter fuscus]|uniref:LysR family transcriptional regulator n=1 Tax=Cystobacter fuscus TaxID=43 RepID=A0A250IXX3_9BACT|nr:LysR family transcriptional regulator [Cystobacter fuscus]ATB36133.1 LysR family transcriptional regulator [Cystobacter fuscus]
MRSMPGTPDWNLLPLFVAVAESGNISEAARKLGAPKSSVSRGVAALERSLGVQLFHRTTRDVRLTTAGTVFYDKARPVLAAYRELTGAIPEQEAEPSGILRITAPADVALTLLVGVLPQFLLRYPGVSLDVRPTNRISDLVGETFDVALRIADKLKDSTLVARRLGVIEMGIYGAPNYVAQFGAPRTLSECAQHRWVLFSGPARLPPVLRSLTSTRVATDDLLFAQGMTRGAVGLSVLPNHLAQEDVLAGRLVRVLPSWKHTVGTLYFVHPPAQHLPRKVTALRDHLVDVFARRPLDR